MLIFKRNPIELAGVVNAVIVALGLLLGWDVLVTGCIVAAVTAIAGVVQYLNVFGTDQFTALAINAVGTILTLMVALGFDQLTDEVQSSLLVIVPLALGLFARNGVTNKHTPAGARTKTVLFADRIKAGAISAASVQEGTLNPQAVREAYEGRREAAGDGDR